MSKKNKKQKRVGKEIPVDFSKGSMYDHHNFWSPTRAERNAIMLGKNVCISMRLFTQHKPGHVALTAIPRIVEAESTQDPRLVIFLKAEAEKGHVQELPKKEEFEKPSENIPTAIK